jgi:hypothetical protein
MVLVAIVAVLMGLGITGYRLIRLRSDYQKLAAQHAREEQSMLNCWGLLGKLSQPLEGQLEAVDPAIDPEIKARAKEFMSEADQREMERFDAETKRQLDLWNQMIANLEAVGKLAQVEIKYHADLKRKYLRAASRPWESVPADAKDPGYTVTRIIAKWELASAASEWTDDTFRQPQSHYREWMRTLANDDSLELPPVPPSVLAPNR